jgi:membrane associated rhomboid family serine protease
MNLADDLKYQFRYGTPVIKLIFINVSVFIFLGLINLGLYLFNSQMDLAGIYLALSSKPEHLLHTPWSVFTYQFVHGGIFHLLFNMLMLYFTGRIFTDFFRKDDVWRVYLFGGLIGGVLYILSSAAFPVFRGSASTLVGASGCIMALLFATATYAPNMRVALFGIIQIRLVWLSLLFLFLDLISIPMGNSGGHIAHIGGALFGYLFAKYRQGRIQIRLFDTSYNKPDERKFKVKVSTFDSAEKRSSNQASNKKPSQEDIDIILDKISRNGYDKLSKQEKEILFKASQD